MKTKSLTSGVYIRLIVLAALGCILFTVGGCFFLYRNTQSLVAAGKRVQHTQEVRLALQNASSLTQQLELEEQIYRLSQDRDQLEISRRLAIQLHSHVSALKDLVAGNPSETLHVEALDSSSLALIKELSRPSPERESISSHLLDCGHALSLMSNEEAELLRERNEASRSRWQLSVNTEIAAGAVGFLLLITLFGFLLRAAIQRNRIAMVTEKANRELNESLQTLQDYARDSQILAIARDDLQLCTDEKQVHQSAATRFSELLPGSNGSICIINSSRNMVETMASWSANQGSPLVAEIFPPDTCCGLRSGHLRWYSPAASQIHCNHFIDKVPQRYLCLPLAAHGQTIGVIFIESPDEAIQKMVESRIAGVQQLVQLTAMALASLQMRQKLEHQSARDGLTGLFNRHFLEIALDREIARAVRRKSTLAVLMIDVDHFKRLNDQFGHAAGDAVLKEIARVFLDKTRTEDLACRYGGEEFTIILPDITPENAWQRAEVIRQAVADLRTHIDNTLYNNVTISVGVAIFPNDGSSSELLLRHADAALYRAKHGGRNRVAMNLNGLLTPGDLVLSVG
jgi:diguanylate cyclase (GGDEF)-like protein